LQQWYKCPNCGAQVAFGVNFCGNCRTQLNWQTQQQTQPPPIYQQQQQRDYGYGGERPKLGPATVVGTIWKNYYEILQVSPNAEPSVIVAAYRRLAQTYHPDTAKTQMSSARMYDINEAYEVLSDPYRRAAYDRTFRDTYKSVDVMTEELTEEEIVIGLVRFAAVKAAEGKKRSEVADELTRQGIPYDIAAEVVNRVFKYRSTLKRKEGGISIGFGLLMLIAGGIIFVVTGGGIIMIGLLIFGGITLLVGFFRLLTS
jgi:hypothetical protein